MDEHALRVLEFEKVTARLSRLTAFTGGRDLALALRPTADPRVVAERQTALWEALRLRGAGVQLNLAGISDVRVPLEKAALGGVLDAQELLAVGATQRVAQQVRGALSRVVASFPRLGTIGNEIAERGDVVTEITKAINARGDVMDAASPALGVIRHDVKRSHDRLQAKLQEFLGSAAGRLASQESIVTLRDGRYVVPIKSDFRGEVRGIVHDVSASGATVFIEPLAVVDLANQWREMQIEEQREIERIFRRLSALAGEHANALTRNVDLLARLDLILASASLGEELSHGGLPILPSVDDVEPTTWLEAKEGRLELREARHPMLTSPVPITLGVGGEDRVLLVTGPNTGGKTVALKTVGLLCLMAQSGLPVPAASGSRLPVFEDILADIGDEQSIEQSLSTFSGHLTNVISLLQRAATGTLVLLDELAAGTDPAEGAALARALLQHLLQRGALTMATTHHGELKLFAHSTPGVRNAAVEFDPISLAPTYRIIVGVPGRSNALAIAARLGLPQEILRVAQESLAPDDVAIDALLTDLHTERAAAEAEHRAEAQARQRAEQARKHVEERLAGLDEERARRLDEAALALEAEVEAAREALARAQRLSSRVPSPFTPEEAQEARGAIGEAEETAKKLRKRSRRRRRATSPRPEQVKPGAAVWVQGVPMAAEVLSLPDRHGDVDVSFGGLRARVAVNQIVRIEREMVRVPERATLPPPPPSAREEIQVRGQTLDEALPEVEKFIDDGFRAGVPRLRVVHGKGTGRMRQAVRDLLAKHPLVKSFAFAAPAEGGEGVTVIDISG